MTFGQAHAHSIAGRTYDADCVAVINCNTAEEGRTLAFDYFGSKFCFEYSEDRFNHSNMHYYPRGYIEVNP